MQTTTCLSNFISYFCGTLMQRSLLLGLPLMGKLCYQREQILPKIKSSPPSTAHKNISQKIATLISTLIDKWYLFTFRQERLWMRVGHWVRINFQLVGKSHNRGLFSQKYPLIMACFCSNLTLYHTAKLPCYKIRYTNLV